MGLCGGSTQCVTLVHLFLTSASVFGGKNQPDSCPQAEHHPNTYEPVQFPAGVSTQLLTFVQALVRLSPMFVFLIPSQKTNATRRTINVYSTKPCPSSSTTNLFKSSIVLSPLSSSSSWFVEKADIMPVNSDHIFPTLMGIRPPFRRCRGCLSFTGEK